MKAGKAHAAGSGFGGKGLDRLEKERDAKEKAERKAYGEGGDEKEEKVEEPTVKPPAQSDDMTFGNFKVEIRRGPAPDALKVLAKTREDEKRIQSSLRAAEEAAAKAGKDTAAYRQAQSVVAKLNAQARASKLVIQSYLENKADPTDFHAIIPINDYPQKARWRVTNKETMTQVGCSHFKIECNKCLTSALIVD